MTGPWHCCLSWFSPFPALKAFSGGEKTKSPWIYRSWCQTYRNGGQKSVPKWSVLTKLPPKSKADICCVLEDLSLNVDLFQ